MVNKRQKRGFAMSIGFIANRCICVQGVPPALTASYDPSFGAPTCLALGSSCQTDDTMIAGVGSFEPNAPNTVDSCTDNSNAVIDQDEYVNRIIVRAKDGGTMQAGSWLEIHVTVDKANDVSLRSKTDAGDVVHIFYASETFEGSSAADIDVDGTHHFANGHWRYICSKMAAPWIGGRSEVFSCDFQIPEGNFEANNCGSLCGIQAIRVNYGYGEYTVLPCTDTPLWVSAEPSGVFVVHVSIV
mmetsp:Transcript_40005/g.83689  ORF Transcript_40005/g.83689 Transcript_40005/m.83689 type:complete len:243 (+) Transcript_40005:2254-2982(+)